jgi:hypothetical protein
MEDTPESLVKSFRSEAATIAIAAMETPETAWIAIVELSRQTLSEKQISLLAAGAIESLLAYHGVAFIDRIEEEARAHSAFRDLLGGVWRSSIPDEVWRRLELIRGQPW